MPAVKAPVQQAQQSTSCSSKLSLDTVKVVVFDPHEVCGAMADQRRHLSVFFSLHQHGHEVVNLVHVHVSHVVTANQNLDENQRNTRYRGRR